MKVRPIDIAQRRRRDNIDRFEESATHVKLLPRRSVAMFQVWKEGRSHWYGPRRRASSFLYVLLIVSSESLSEVQ